ncbi:hypothetical protein DEIPH_ctg021orf0076 [Deinococcus phoenicis]|uniref:Uncharacterized protein n=1 Tax=Deinococcus phoenicis TaxID=1476583 RepID=A0A016QRR8_9DEIO|nr:hypothetical protein [Deinococcus phoenicis]EYB68557.1 hypothetical protein DEIPH_ctg021orf0076 [Deinococcus phoenicis]
MNEPEINAHPFLLKYVTELQQQRGIIREHAELHGLTVPDFIQAVRLHLKAILARCDLWLEVSPERLEGLLDTGKLPNFFNDPEKYPQNAVVEFLIHDPRVRLNYAFLTDAHPAEYPGHLPTSPVLVKLRPALKEISSFTEGGTITNLHPSKFGHISGVQAREMFAVLEAWGNAPNYLWYERTLHEHLQELQRPIVLGSNPRLPSPIINPHELSWGWEAYRLWDGQELRKGCPLCEIEEGRVHLWHNDYRLFEPYGDDHRFAAFVPGILEVSDIEEVFFRPAGVRQTFGSRLRELGVPVSYSALQLLP